MGDERPPLTPQDLLDAETTLVTAINQVALDTPGNLSGGASQPLSNDALLGLKQTRVTFGNPTDDLVRLSPQLFASINVALSPIRQQQMQTQFDFYYMTLHTTLQPARGAQFTRLECSLDFGPKGQGEPIVQTIFPSSSWKPVLNWSGGLNLGLNGNLDWSAGVDTPEQIAGLDLPGAVKANIDNKNALKALVVVPDYHFDLGRSEIAAGGEGDSRCFWRVESPDLQQKQSYAFGVVFKVPKGTTSITLEGVLAAEPNMPWLAANLRDVLDDLSQKLRAIFLMDDAARQGKDRLPIGSHETWTLPLPA